MKILKRRDTTNDNPIFGFPLWNDKYSHSFHIEETDDVNNNVPSFFCDDVNMDWIKDNAINKRMVCEYELVNVKIVII